MYERASGVNVVDVDGNRYVDMSAGFGALPLGHADPSLEQALVVPVNAYVKVPFAGTARSGGGLEAALKSRVGSFQ